MRLIDTSLPDAFRLKEEIEGDLKKIEKGNEGKTFAVALEKYLEIIHFRNKKSLSVEEAHALDKILSELSSRLESLAKKRLHVKKADLSKLQRDKDAARETLLKLLITELFFPSISDKGIDREAILSHWMNEFSITPEAPVTKTLLTPEIDFFKNQYELKKAA